ncbi:hypothetical protein SEA_DRE3_61 [Gordonia phage Dre3]|uniref:Uncharacterized protein n=1 Tax=Gordonia phage Gibbous TaxID=2652405 RepID=A0A5J6T5W9_9CAUD|nr:hypothetical protein QLQ74_gp61 [Gordonia phage Gibbous]QFG05137.1 hypothetical protein SEA_GIBBOUS_61 [Gordonia phage Gibbous]QRI45990.1 hypothetical protein SEA_DRE3_61 [Gordonia phage Dre3]
MTITHLTVEDTGEVQTWFPARGVELDVEEWVPGKWYLRLFRHNGELGWAIFIFYWNHGEKGWLPIRLIRLGVRDGTPT